MSNATDSNEIAKLMDMLDGVEKRLSTVEAIVKNSYAPKTEILKPVAATVTKESSEDIEFRLGEKWFGKIGIIAFLLAVVNFLVLPFASIPHHIILGLGFVIALGLISSSFAGKGLLKTLAGYLMGSGLILLFISTLRLHFFSTEPFLTGKTTLLLLLFFATGISFFFSLRRNSSRLTSLSMLFFFSTALISDDPILIFAALIVGSIVATLLDKKFGWNGITIFALVLTYLVHLLWYLNNPVLGKELMILQEWNLNLLVIPVYMLIYGAANAVKKDEAADDYYSVLKTIFNSIGGFGLFIFVAINSNYNYSGLLGLLLSIVLFVLAVAHWANQKSQYSTFLYSMLAYAALSISIFITFPSPGYFIWLCWQSLAVVSTALWFRSKFIVVANFFIYVSLVIAYAANAGAASMSAISFGIVALISARIMNWQKERLELRTENLRLGYLIIAFLTLPFVLYSNLASQFVGISFIILAFGYYLIGKIINNQKYRLMASGTLVLSLVYIFIFGLTSSETTYKIFSFLLVSVALIIISVVYAKVRAKEKPEE